MGISGGSYPLADILALIYPAGMVADVNPGLGELLRHLTELVDSGAEAAYRAEGLRYRPRYTPVMRALAGGERTINDITASASITQGAVSQTVKLMEADGLVKRRPGLDARHSALSLTTEGRALLSTLEAHWTRTFEAIARLEAEIGYPVREVLKNAIAALEKKGFDERLRQTKRPSPSRRSVHAQR